MIEKHEHPEHLVVRGLSVRDAIAQRDAFARRHYGPGTHPGTGSEQTVHGSGGGGEAKKIGPRKHMLLTAELRKRLPPIRSQESKGKEAKALVKFFTPMSNWTWYASEFDPESGDFYGLVEGHEREYGYFNLKELEDLVGPGGMPGVERDLYWEPTSFSEIERKKDVQYWETAKPDTWVPASGGTEKPFKTSTGRRLQYVWNPATGQHAYLDMDTDLILSQDEAERALGQKAMTARHYGPGAHPGTGTEQTVHAGGSPSSRKEHVRFDPVGFIMDLEEGNLDADQAVEGIGALMRQGILQHLQGTYHRTAQNLIDAGYLSPGGEVLRLPSEDEDRFGTSSNYWPDTTVEGDEKRYPRELTVPERHQLRIAYDTLKMSDVGANIMGGMTKDEAREVITRLTGKAPVERDEIAEREAESWERFNTRLPYLPEQGGGRKEYSPPRAARKTVTDYLASSGIPGRVKSARTVGFSDLARGSGVFVNVEVEGATTEQLQALHAWQKEQPFIVQVSGTTDTGQRLIG